jgi:hypothetical protein
MTDLPFLVGRAIRGPLRARQLRERMELRASKRVYITHMRVCVLYCVVLSRVLCFSSECDDSQPVTPQSLAFGRALTLYHRDRKPCHDHHRWNNH